MKIMRWRRKSRHDLVLISPRVLLVARTMSFELKLTAITLNLSVEVKDNEGIMNYHL